MLNWWNVLVELVECQIKRNECCVGIVECQIKRNECSVESGGMSN